MQPFGKSFWASATVLTTRNATSCAGQASKWNSSSLCIIIEILGQLCFPAGGQIVNQIVLQPFIDGQPTPELRLQLSTNRPATLDDAVQWEITITTAYKVEALRNGTTRVQETVAAATNNAPQSEQAQFIAVLQRLEQKLDTLTMGQKPPPRRSCRDTDRRCYVCNEPGHFARNCPNRRHGNWVWLRIPRSNPQSQIPILARLL